MSLECSIDYYFIPGRQGIFTSSSGLKIAYLSGVEGSGEKPDISFTVDDVNNLVTPPTADSAFKGVDILLTSQWPEGVEKYGITPVSESVANSALT